MESDAERTVSNLFVLSALSHNDKLLTNGETFAIYAPTTMRALVRTFYGERREQNIARVRQTVHSAIRYASKSLEEANAMHDAHGADAPPSALRLRIETTALQHFRMLDALQRSCTGLRNLTQTYRDDAALASQISLLVGEVSDFTRVIGPHSEALRRRCGASAAPEGSERRSLLP